MEPTSQERRKAVSDKIDRLKRLAPQLRKRNHKIPLFQEVWQLLLFELKEPELTLDIIEHLSLSKKLVAVLKLILLNNVTRSHVGRWAVDLQIARARWERGFVSSGILHMWNTPVSADSSQPGSMDFTPGDVFQNQRHCHHTGIHFHVRKGIHGNLENGAYSVITYGGSRETGKDKDEGNILHFSGVRKVQIEQDYPIDTRCLIKAETNHSPIRVLRGSGGRTLTTGSKQPWSTWIPSKGIRYDGLYEITGRRYLNEKGKEVEDDEHDLHYNIRFEMTRLPNSQNKGVSLSAIRNRPSVPCQLRDLDIASPWKLQKGTAIAQLSSSI
ncbi:hypothetical protein BJ508DRAFT_330116 [Ascobolus immersus RN42]|uniref:YDG domain-containing protein n=1 Tax=Ascobolus immersus RN42 TaxID=1160509 RepID=A0A3N4HUZ1_ASCIM|nr:hypothetical protein BJ508DRAFT_330116 [Ascobolus immersus RN42]